MTENLLEVCTHRSLQKNWRSAGQPAITYKYNKIQVHWFDNYFTIRETEIIVCNPSNSHTLTKIANTCTIRLGHHYSDLEILTLSLNNQSLTHIFLQKFNYKHYNYTSMCVLTLSSIIISTFLVSLYALWNP